MYLFVCLSACLPVCLFIYLSICKLETHLFCDTSSIFELDNIQNEAILRDFLNFGTWQHPKRSNSARLLQFSKLATSKTKQFCETSFKYGKSSAELTASYQCGLRFSHSTCLKYCVCHEKVMPGHTKCCTCHAKSSSQTWRSDAPKCNPSPEISALTSLHLWWTCLLYCACHGKCIFADPLQMTHACHRFWTCYKTLTFCSLLTRCTMPCACHAKRRFNVQKWRVHVLFCRFWLRNVLRDFPTFSHTWILFLRRLSLFDLLSSSLLFSSLLWLFHLCFSSVHIVGSLTSKLPSAISHDYISL